MKDNNSEGPGTTAVWAGEEETFWQRSTQVPVVHSVSFGYPDLDQWLEVNQGKQAGHIYSRNTSPTVQVLEAKIQQMEGAEAATSFSTGMAAISNTLFAILSPGDRVVSIKDSYGGTNKLFTEFLPRFQIEVTLCDTTDYEQVVAAIAGGCRVLYLESPTNPTLKLVDIQRLAQAASTVGAVTVVDNTFATPINQKPIELGADLVVHSATKFLGGHADALGGLVCGRSEWVQKIFHYREINGATLDPLSAYLLLRGMKTLQIRVERQGQSALKIASLLEQHPAVSEVFYPGLPSHPQHGLARQQMKGFGGMLSFSLRGGLRAVKRLLSSLRFAHCAANLGAVETIVGIPATTSHCECTPEEREAMGIPETLIRYSTGIEDVEDLIADLEQALK